MGTSKIRRFGLGISALLVFACLARGGEPTTTSDRVETIKRELSRIDAEYQATDTKEHYRVAKSLSHWELSGLIEGGSPVYLQATFSEGSVVREETYYLKDRKPILVAVAQWLDLDDSAKSARSRKELRFYIDEDQVIRRVSRRSGAPGPGRTDDVPGPSADLAKRPVLIARILAGELAGHDARESLEAVPEAFSAIP